MADINSGRFNRFIQKLFYIQSGGPASVHGVDPAVQTVLEYESGLENRYLQGIETFAAADSQAAVAGNKAAFQIRNPTGSGVIITIEKIFVFTTVSEQFNWMAAGSNPADLATSTAGHPRADPRYRSTPSAIITHDAPAVDPGGGFLFLGAMNGLQLDFILFDHQEVVLLPGIAMRVIGQALNQNLIFTVFWRERPLETSELT